MDDVSFFPDLETRLELQHKMGTIWSNKIKQWFKYQQHKKKGGFSKMSIASVLLKDIEKLSADLESVKLELYTVKATKAAVEVEEDIDSVVSSEYNESIASVSSVSTTTTFFLNQTAAVGSWDWQSSDHGKGPNLNYGEYYGIKIGSAVKRIQLGARGGVKRSDGGG